MEIKLAGGIDPGKTFAVFRRLRGKGHAFKRVRTWARAPVGGLLLYGPPGTGKTHLLHAAGNEVVDRHGMLAVLQPTVRIPRHDEDAVLALADPCETPVLLLDDVGAEKMTGRGLECLQKIVDGRLRDGGPMLVTTNFRPEDLERVLGGLYGPRLMGRFLELGGYVPVGGRDMRNG